MTAPFVPPGDDPSDRIRALFLSSFSVMDVAGPLASFDAESFRPGLPAGSARQDSRFPRAPLVRR